MTACPHCHGIDIRRGEVIVGLSYRLGAHLPRQPASRSTQASVSSLIGIFPPHSRWPSTAICHAAAFSLS
jgi:hypothetical protein